MVRLTIVAALHLLLLQQAPLEQGPATIQGIVFDGTSGQPLEGASVSLVPSDNPAFPPFEPRPTASTNAEGRFSIETNRTGGFRVVSSKNGLVPYRESDPSGASLAPGLPGVWIRLNTSTIIKNLQLYLVRPAVISGRALDSEGRLLSSSLAFAELHRYFFDQSGKHSIRPIQNPDITGGRLNDRGEFRFYNLPPGKYFLGIGVLGSGGMVGHWSVSYYPDLTTDETKAAAISVRAGEEVNVGTLQLPPRQPAVEFRVRLTAPDTLNNVAVTVGGNSFRISSTSNVGERSLQILPGHYDLRAVSDTPRPAYFASATFDVSTTNVTQDLALKLTPHLTGKLLLENAAGERVPVPAAIRCQLDGYPIPNCIDSRVVPGPYELEFPGLPEDTYVASAKAGSQNILTDGLYITGDTELEIVFKQPGGMLQGVAHKSADQVLVNGSIVLVPDAPYRMTNLRYRSVLSGPDGKFEIHGIAPGAYKIYAWTRLEGAAFRNAEFMKEFEDRGERVEVQENTSKTIEITAF